MVVAGATWLRNDAGELVLVGGVEQFLSASNRKAAVFDPATRTWCPRPAEGEIPPPYSWTSFAGIALDSVEGAAEEAPARFVLAAGGHGARRVNRTVRCACVG